MFGCFEIMQFNRKPTMGIEHLVSNGLVKNSPASIALFLKSTPSLDKVEYHLCVFYSSFASLIDLHRNSNCTGVSGYGW